MSVVEVARQLIQQPPHHRVVSVYLDLDPGRFATARARASQVDSLMDAARREVDSDPQLSHEERTGLREDLRDLRAYLLSREAPFQGARSLAVFRSRRNEISETVVLSRSEPAQVVIGRRAYVAPLIEAAWRHSWGVALVNRREARLFTGTPDSISEVERREDDVHGQHDQGGWSQANYERSYENDTDEHLRRAAEQLQRRFRQQPFDRLALGGPAEIVPRFEAQLNDEVRARLAPERIDVDVGHGTEQQVRESLAKVVPADEKRDEREALDRLAAGIGTGGRAVGGTEGTVEALNERRVGALLLAPDFDRSGWQCLTCGLLTLAHDGECPVDGSELERLEHLHEGAVEAALIQDAEILVIRQYPDLGPFEGIAALLRF